MTDKNFEKLFKSIFYNLLGWRHFAGIVSGAEATSVAAESAGAHVRHAEAVGRGRSCAEVIVESLCRLLHLDTQ